MNNQSLEQIEETAARLLREATESKEESKVDALVDCLSAIPTDDRFAALQAILGEDLSRQWEQGQRRPRIETYQSLLQEKIPELTDSRLLAHLSEVELKARCRWPEPRDHPTVADYHDRFPDRPEIRNHLLSICYDDGRYVRYGLPLRGGMGRVWQTRDLHLQRQVALKEPLPERASYSEVLQRLANEAYVTARLNHPAIVTVHEVDAADDGPYYVMQWVEGEELKDAITRLHSQPNKNSASLFRELLRALSTVCDAIAYAHDQGVIHRDLKPANIIMGKYGELIVLDWGLARSDDGVEITFDPNDTIAEADDAVLQSAEETPATNSMAPTVEKTEFIGTPLYMPPEQIDGDMSHRCDIFSLGAILYHILTGRPPRTFDDGTNRTTVARRVKSEPIVPPSQIKPDVPRSLEAVCLKAMQPNALDRYQSATELRDELERYLADEPVTAYRETGWERFQRALRRQVRFAAAFTVAATLIAVVAGVGAIAFGWQWNRAEGATTEALENLEATKKERDRVTRILDRSRKVVSSFIDKAATKLTAAPRIADVRQDMLREGLSFYEFIIAEQGQVNDADTPETINAHFEIANISSALGLTAKAQKQYEIAIRRSEAYLKVNPENESMRVMLGKLLNNYSNLLRDNGQPARALEVIMRSGREWKRLQSQHPENWLYSRNYAGHLTSVATIQFRLEEFDESRKTYLKALRLLNEYCAANPREAEAIGLLAGAQMGLANILDEIGQLSESVRYHRLAVGSFHRLLAAKPTNRETAINLAIALNNLAITLRGLKRLEECDQTYQQAIELNTRILKSDPAIPGFADALAGNYLNRGFVLLDLRQFTAARSSFGEAVRLRRDLARRFPGNATYQLGLVASLINFAKSSRDVRNGKESTKLFNEARSILVRLRTTSPSDRRVLHGWSEFHVEYGVFLIETGRFDEAVKTYETVINLYRKRRGESPDNEQLAFRLAAAYGNNGFALEQLGRVDDALKSTRQAAAIHLAFARRSTQSIIVCNNCTRSCGRQILLLKKLKRPGDALKVAREFREVLPQHGPGLWEIAHFLAPYLLDIGKAGNVMTADEQQLYDRVAGECVLLLQKAAAAGFRNSRIFTNDPNLKPLHALPGFQKLIEALKATDQPIRAKRPRSSLPVTPLI